MFLLLPFKSMRLKFSKRSEEKFISRIDPDSVAYRDLTGYIPRGLPRKRVHGPESFRDDLGFIPIDYGTIRGAIIIFFRNQQVFHPSIEFPI
jgi:hypothetical protein